MDANPHKACGTPATVRSLFDENSEDYGYNMWVVGCDTCHEDIVGQGRNRTVDAWNRANPYTHQQMSEEIATLRPSTCQGGITRTVLWLGSFLVCAYDDTEEGQRDAQEDLIELRAVVTEILDRYG